MPKALSSRWPSSQPTKIETGSSKASVLYSAACSVKDFLRATTFSVTGLQIRGSAEPGSRPFGVQRRDCCRQTDAVTIAARFQAIHSANKTLMRRSIFNRPLR